MRLPTEHRDFESPGWLAREIGELLSSIFPLPASYQQFLGAWVLAGWDHYRALSPPMLIVLGPRKSRELLLPALALLCTNALVITDATAPAILRACGQYSPTLLILDCGLRPDVPRLLKASLRPDSLVLGQNGPISPYGPRLLACSDRRNGPELLSEAVVLSLPPGECPYFDKLDHPATVERARLLMASLLLFRLRSAGTAAPVAGDPPPGWSATEWGIFRLLTAPVSSDAQFCEQLRHGFKKDFEVAPLPPLPPAKFATLKAVFSLAHENVRDVSVIELSKKVNEALEDLGEATISPRRAGAVLAEFGFPKRARGDHGNHKIEFHRLVLERIHQLALQCELKIWMTPEMAA